MPRSTSLIIFVLSLGLILSGSAQETPQLGTVRLSRYGDLLREHNVALTEPALVDALKNQNVDVRYLAAMKLAEDKAVNAIPAMKEALANEKVPRARVNIALALGLLGDQIGSAELKKVCGDRNFIPEFRLYAVRYMFDLHFLKDEACLAAAEEIVVGKSTNFGDRNTALELLPQFQNLTGEESREILQLVADRLKDPEPVVRMAASQSLASLGNPSAIPYLEAAIASEKDESVRSVFERDLAKLQDDTTRK